MYLHLRFCSKEKITSKLLLEQAWTSEMSLMAFNSHAPKPLDYLSNSMHNMSGTGKFHLQFHLWFTTDCGTTTKHAAELVFISCEVVESCCFVNRMNVESNLLS